MPSTIWLCRVLLVSSLTLPSVISRYIDDGEHNEESDEKFDFDILLEKVLSEDYSEIALELENIEAELKRLKVRIEDTDAINKRFEEDGGKVKEQKDPFDGSSVDYDYQGDAPQSPAVQVDKEKVMEVMSGANVSLPFSIANRSAEDPTMMKEQRERSKELRLNAIRSTILELRNSNGNNSNATTQEGNSTLQFSKTLQNILETKMPRDSFIAFTEKLQSFYPSCDVPRQTKEEVWTETNSMNILFDITFPTPEEGTGLNIVVAKLRLYKKIPTNSIPAAAETNTSSSRAGKMEKSSYGTHFMPGDRTNDDERRIRVSVYWYTRNVRKNRVKKKLMDSQMFSIGGENQWMEFNIRTAVRAWRENERNHGLVVTVDDEDGVMLPAERYLHAMNCSKGAANTRPIPSIIVDAAKQYMKQQQVNNDSTSASGGMIGEEVNPFPDYLYPKLDICTVEVPLADNRPIPETSCSMKKGPDVFPDNLLRNVRNETTARPITSRRPTNESRGTYFNVVGIGSPSSGPNRNALVPILTKSDVVTAPEDIRMKNELLRVQTEAPRLRHSRKHVTSTKSESN